MKQIFFIAALFISASVLGQVNMWTYDTANGGNNNGTLEQSEVQNALNNESNLIVSPAATITLSSTLSITQGFAHTIAWSSSTVTTNSALLVMIDVDKRASNGGTTTMSDLLVDGNGVASRGIQIDSRIDFDNVDVTGFRQPTSQSPAGFYINFYNDSDAHGDWIMDGCDATDLIGASNGSTTDSWGAANGYLVYVRQLPSATTRLLVSNATSNNSWGEDAQNMAFFSGGLNTAGSNWSFEGTNLNLYDWERRCVKGFLGNQTWTNCTFTDPSPSDPDLYSSNKSGMVVVGAGSGATGAGNTVFEGCTFISRGYDGRVIVIGDQYTPSLVEYNNCTFSGGADLALTRRIGDIDVCGGDFGPGSIIYDYNVDGDFGDIRIGQNNTFVEGNPINLNTVNYTEPVLTCTPPAGGGAVTAITWNNDTQSINSGQTVDLGFTFTPSNPSDTGYSISSDAPGVVSNAGAWVSAGTATLTITADDTTNGTITDDMTVTANAADTGAPIVQNLTAYSIQDDRFTLSWTLNEPSRGWVLYGTTSDPTAPYSYDQETTHETSFTYQTHIQQVGGNTQDNTDPFLSSGTTYYYRIYTEDAAGNIGYSDEFTVTTTPNCSDGIQNGTETGIDCGGSCSPCISAEGRFGKSKLAKILN